MIKEVDDTSYCPPFLYSIVKNQNQKIMTRPKYIMLTLILLSIGTISYGQTISDALRYAVLTPQGTARVAGVGGSFGAMGGDIGVMSINPAGLAGFYKSEFTFTPTITSTNTNAFLVEDSGNATTQSKTNFGMSNMAAVFVTRPSSGKWQTSNFTIGFQKVADLNKAFIFRGTSVGSYSESLSEVPERIFGIPYQNASLAKEQIISQKGYVSELNLGWAGSYDNKLDIGISLGVPFVSFEEEKTYTEEDATNDLDVFNRYDRQDYLNASGAGINFKVGFIYKGIKPLRIGASVHSPSYLSITEDFGESDEYTFDDGDTDALESDGTFKYKYKTPWKVNGSIGVLYNLGKIKGFANADVEFLDYSSSNFDLGAFSTEPDDINYGTELNTEIATQLGSVVNLRLGTELAYDKFRIRLGTGLLQSPYSTDSDEGQYSSTYSFGIGLREENFYLDLSYARNSNDEGYIAYNPENVDHTPLANTETTKGVIQFTAGFKF